MTDPGYSVHKNRVVRGSEVVAWLRPRGRVIMVYVGSELIGAAESNAHAMLMVARHYDEVEL